MTSEIRTNSLKSRAGLSTVTLTDSGPMFSGITTFVDNSTFSVGTGGTIHAPATNTLNIGVNNTESIRIDSNSNLKVAGIVTATHFYGNGANLSGLPAGTTINSNTNNYLITGTGTANTLQGEANLIFDGSSLGINVTSPSYPLDVVGDGGGSFSASSNSTNGVLSVVGKNSSGSVSAISRIKSYPDGSSNQSHMAFETRNSSNTMVEALRIDSAGNMSLGKSATASTNYGANFQIHDTGTSGAALHLTDNNTGSSNSDGFHLVQQGAHIYHWNRESGDQVFATAANERLRITSGGNVRHTGGGDNRMYTFSSDDSAHYMKFNSTLNGIILNGYGGIAFETNGANERLRIDSSGRLIIGYTGTDDRDGYNSALQVSGTGGDDSSLTIGRWSNDSSNPALVFSKSRSTTIGSHAVLNGNDYLGTIQFQGDDGSNYHVGASIQARVENFSGAADTDDMSTRILFNTNRDESNVGNRMIIHGRGSDYNVLYGGRVDILGYEGQNITGGTMPQVLNEQFLVCPSAASGYADNHTITFGQTKGDWFQGVNSGYNTSFGLLWNWGNTGYAATRQVRAGIHYDHRGTERFKIWSSYGDILFKVDSGQSGNETAETCDTTAMQMTHDGIVMKPEHPAFSAYKYDNSSQVSSGVYVFNTVSWNRGNHYNSSNGRFTAPVAGFYFFHFTLQGYGGTSGGRHVRIQLNGTDYWNNGTNTPFYDEGAGNHHNWSMGQGIYMAEGDYATVTSSQGMRGMQSGFSGFLVG